MNFVGVDQMKAMLCRKTYMNFHVAFIITRTMFVKFGTGGFHIMLLSHSEFLGDAHMIASA